MFDGYLTLLRTLKGYAEEANVMGADQAALTTVADQYTRIFETLRNETPEDPVWNIINPLGPEPKNYGEVILAITLLEQYIYHRSTQQTEPSRWCISKNLELKGCYKGEVIVEPGCTFTLAGHLDGNVTLKGNAVLCCLGSFGGDVYADEESVIECLGSMSGSVKRSVSDESDGM